VKSHESDGARGDVVQSGFVSILDDELPPPSMARNLLSMFKQMEQEQGAVDTSSVPVNTGGAGKSHHGAAGKTSSVSSNVRTPPHSYAGLNKEPSGGPWKGPPSASRTAVSTSFRKEDNVSLKVFRRTLYYNCIILC